jgi:phosphate transport system protein
MHRLSIGTHELHTRLLVMGEMVEVSLTRSIESLVTRDQSLAERVLRDELRINALEMEIDDLAIKLIALHQPVACDLRFITAALKINTDLERIGDLAVTIARRGLSLMSEPEISSVSQDVQVMSAQTISMLSRSLTALLYRDVEVAREVLKADDEVDFLRDKTNRVLVSVMEDDPTKIATGIDLIFITRSLERIADHATNIAEDVLFLMKGIDVRHHAEVREQAAHLKQ